MTEKELDDFIDLLERTAKVAKAKEFGLISWHMMLSNLVGQIQKVIEKQ